MQFGGELGQVVQRSEQLTRPGYYRVAVAATSWMPRASCDGSQLGRAGRCVRIRVGEVSGGLAGRPEWDKRTAVSRTSENLTEYGGRPHGGRGNKANMREEQDAASENSLSLRELHGQSTE